MLQNPFESIESAHDFVTLLAQAIGEARQEIEADVEREKKSAQSRRLDALRMASYQLALLEQHIKRSGRILNDLRSVRRLLLDERSGVIVTASEEKPLPAYVTGGALPESSGVQVAALRAAA